MMGSNSKADMAISDLLKPRFIIALIALIAAIVMMYLGTIEPETGVTIILGILVAFGAYYARSPRDKR